ncbi:hypothetical protein BMS3Abin01_00925 [bacterium BMS3Abin01]|nr:hypothetical protein BMS3Abin01_00925 [bacterium BMS3Abin01]
MRGPKTIKEAAQAWPSRWDAVDLGSEGLEVKHYHKGEAVATYASDGPGDYDLVRIFWTPC